MPENEAVRRGPARRILYLQYTNPAAYPPLEHSSRILADSGWKVLFLGILSPGTERMAFAPHPRVRVRRLAASRTGWRQKLHYLAFGLWVLLWTLRWRPRWVYASDPLSTPFALLLRLIPGIRVVYHEHDAPVFENLGPDGTPTASGFMRRILAARRRLAHHAELCVIPGERRAESFAAEVSAAARVVSVRNCPGREEVLPYHPRGNWPELRLVYHGSIVPGRLPTAVVEAMARLPAGAVSLRVIGYETAGHPDYVKRLLELAERFGRGGQVHFLGTLPRREDILAQCVQCDVGLALMPADTRDVNERTMAGASNKPFDYLSSGLALLVSDLPDWREMYADTGYARVCDPRDPGSIAAALHWYLANREECRRMGSNGRQRVLDEWNYQEEFARVQAVLEDAGSAGLEARPSLRRVSRV